MRLLPQLIEKVEKKTDLSAAEMAQAMEAILETEIGEGDIARFLAGLRDKGETAEELYGLLVAMRARMRPVDLGDDDFIDTCGTGGTGKRRFNISTAASLIAAAAGAKIAKHGNRAASSQSGSADFLEALGYRLSLSQDELRRAFRETNFCFCYAPQFHPAMAKVAAARRRLGTKTIFNCLGPLLNPAGATRQVIGVYSRERMALMAQAIAREPKAEAMLLHGEDGMDEITMVGKTHGLHVHGGVIDAFELDPAAYGYAYCQARDLEGGSASENAETFRRICRRDIRSPLVDCVELNAAFMYAFYRREPLSMEHLNQIASTNISIPNADFAHPRS